MKKLILLILIFSCVKNFKYIATKDKDINEELVQAINDNDTNKSIELINKGADINYIYGEKSILDITLSNRNLEITKILIKKGIEINKDNVIKVYDLALEDFNYEIIDLIKDKYKLEEGLINNNKYFFLLCYTSSAREVKNYIKKNNIEPEKVKDKINRNALIIAAAGNKIGIFKMLIENYKFNINHKNENGATPLIAASNINSKELIKFIIGKGANVNDKDNDGWSALIRAASIGNIKIVDFLIEKVSDVNEKEIDGWTALMLASQNNHLEIIKKLIKVGANVDDEDNEGDTALTIASQNGHLEIINELIKAGAAINHSNKYGISSLIRASQHNQIKVVKLLLEKGANINDRTNNGWTPLLISAENGNLELVKELIERGADINDKENDGWNALMFAAQDGYLEILKLLIERGMSIHDKEDSGWTALMIASKHDHLNVIKELIEKGANVNDKDIDGQSSLIIASQEGHIKVVEELIKANANIYMKDKLDKTALIHLSENLKLFKDKSKRDELIEIAYMIIRKMSEDYIKLFISSNKDKDIPQDIKDDLHNHLQLLYSLQNLPVELFEKIVESII